MILNRLTTIIHALENGSLFAYSQEEGVIQIEKIKYVKPGFWILLSPEEEQMNVKNITFLFDEDGVIVAKYNETEKTTEGEYE